jgi:anti-sigma28 factor (negative regulator of flagellin synthesis)
MMIFDRPTNAELVEVVSEFLEKEIKINLPDHLAFKTQIAINVLNIVKREQQNEEILSKESKEILLNLFKDPNKANIRELAKQIETGELKLDDKELQEALIEITKKKISVDNPKYSTYKKLIE